MEKKKSGASTNKQIPRQKIHGFPYIESDNKIGIEKEGKREIQSPLGEFLKEVDKNAHKYNDRERLLLLNFLYSLKNLN